MKEPRMDTQQQHSPHKESYQPWTAIISLLLSSLGGLMLLLLVGFNQVVLGPLMCFLSHSLLMDENGRTFIVLFFIYLPLMLAVVFGFIAGRSSASSSVRVASLALALGLFFLSVGLSPFVLFLTSYSC